MQPNIVAKAAPVLDHCIEPGAEAWGQGCIDIHCTAKVTEPIGGGGDLPAVAEGRPLQHAVDNSAAAAASEDHCVRAFQHLDPRDVVEVAEILDVVAHAIDEEIRRAGIAAQHELVAIAFPGAAARARHEGQELSHRPNLLVFNLRR